MAHKPAEIARQSAMFSVNAMVRTISRCNSPSPKVATSKGAEKQ
jgi:hypothetical protein